MSSPTWFSVLALVVIAAALIAAKWSVAAMVRCINRSAAPEERISLKWWPNYKDRRILRLYHSMYPQGRWHFVYAGSLGGAFVVFLIAMILAAHTGH
jgi:hypothetical protein